MEFTQEQLESMSDFELNVVAAYLFYDGGEVTTSPAKFGVQVHVNGAFVDDSYNPCNSWSDCGDLIDECKGISIYPISEDDHVNKSSSLTGEWESIGLSFGDNNLLTDISGMFTSINKNPKRAVTIVYILVKQSQK